ncbi:hypothetical protein FOA52_008871 [Chlamydomonas sp. UWO 241]|nr:hypothetical protein FOA52_008871 [Chlamydomonas sp. UWO 241]
MQRLLGCLLPSRRLSSNEHHEERLQERPNTTVPLLHSSTPRDTTASDGSSRILCHIILPARVCESGPSYPPPGCFLRVDTARGGPLCWIQSVGAGAVARAALSGGGDGGKPSARISLESVSLALRDLCHGGSGGRDGSLPSVCFSSFSSSAAAAAGTATVITAATHAPPYLADCLADVAAWVLCGPEGDAGEGGELGGGVLPAGAAAAPPVRTWVVPPRTGAGGGSGGSDDGSSGQALLPPGSSIDVAVVYMATAGKEDGEDGAALLRAALLLTVHVPERSATPAAAAPASPAGGQLQQTSPDPCSHSAPRKAVRDRALIPAGGTPLDNSRPAAATATAKGSADSDRLAMMVQGMPCIVTLLDLQPSASCASGNGGQGSTSALSLGAVLTQNGASVRHWGEWRGRDAAPLVHRLFGARDGSVGGGGGGGGTDETALADLHAHLAACMDARRAAGVETQLQGVGGGETGEHARAAAALWRRVLKVPSARACAVMDAAGTGAGVGAATAAATAPAAADMSDPASPSGGNNAPLLRGPLRQLVEQYGGGGGDDGAALRARLIARVHSAHASLVPLLASTPEASTLEEEQLEGRLLSLQARLTAVGGVASAAKQNCLSSLQDINDDVAWDEEETERMPRREDAVSTGEDVGMRGEDVDAENGDEDAGVETEEETEEEEEEEGVEADEEEHEVTAVLVTDPVTGRLACLITQVSILFMDIVGFTSMAKEVPAHQVMEFLQELFSVFDALCDHYDVYKVRIGIHTGACVSGLIGTRQPKFALFGDTMNTSSRMESTATPGCIQVSKVTYALLPPPDARLFRATNGIEVKGKAVVGA